MEAYHMMSTDSLEPTNPKCCGCEKRAAQTLTATRCFVDGLRSAPCLISSSSCHDISQDGDGSSSLFAHLDSLGVLKQVEELQHATEVQSTEAEPEGTSIGSLLQNNYDVDERKHILHRFVFPLLQNLEQCYNVLDKLPQQAHNNAQPNLSDKKGRKSKAPPPPGMLSLNDYTNVACLLEFAISISLVPCLEYPNAYFPSLQQSQATASTKNKTLTTIDLQVNKINKHSTCIMAQRRNQALPKSLAGRISKTALMWGSACTAKNHNLAHDQLSALCTEQSETNNEHTLHQLYYTINIFQAYNELTNLATAIGYLLLLDRFRPMLLPRHLSDVYLSLLIGERLRWYLSRLDKNIPSEIMAKDKLLATMMEKEKAQEKCTHERLWSLQKALLLSPLVFPSSFISSPKPDTTTSITHKSVDCREAALAYRNLLGGGASMIGPKNNPFTPAWLRLRLGQCLTKIAQVDLQSVVEVFVAQARGPGDGTDRSDSNGSINDDVMTGAAARLARALCAEPTSGSRESSFNALTLFQERLCSQFVNFLAAEGEAFMVELKANNGNNGLARSRPSMAMHLTLWATISQLPLDSLQSTFISKLMSGLVPAEIASTETSPLNTLTATQSTAAIAVWLFTVPSSLDPSTKKKVQSFLLEPFIDNQLTMLGQLLRLVGSLSENETTPSPKSTLIVEVNEQDDNDKVLSRLAEMTIAQVIHILSTINVSETKSGQTKVASLALGLLRAISSNSFDSEGYCFKHFKEKDSLVYTRKSANEQIGHTHLVEGTQARAKCLVKTILSLSQLADEKNTEITADCMVTSTLFRLALFLHFSSCHGTTTAAKSKAEFLGFEELLTNNSDSQLKMAATVLLAALCEDCDPTLLLGSGQGPTESDTGVLSLLGLIVDSAAGCISDDKTISADDDDLDELFSTASIVLSLLIALLELGAEKRSGSDETFFKSLLPSLETLSSGVVSPELAEMASHAMALIAARGAMAEEVEIQQQKATTKKSRLELVLDKLAQAENDLQSTQPPFRAKGVVALRHIARSLINEGGTSSCEDTSRIELLPQQEEQKGLVTELNYGDKAGRPFTNTEAPVQLSEKDELALISRTLAKVCLEALADSESYVYLASIQTLVAISDVCPSEIMPLMGSVIAKGVVMIEVVQLGSNVTSAELSLTPEQRIKATEALMFMIRRRGDSIFAYGPSLLELMLYGHCIDERSSDANMPNEDAPHIIQSETHSYFMGDKSSGADIQNESDEKKIRLNTGGPVFAVEEADVLRAEAISIVCELVSALDPAIVASYCHILVRLATDALQLDASRPVRRIAASLAREVYACTMKEITTQNGSNEECSSTMAVAIMNTSEQSMFDILSRCVSSNDTAVNGKSRLVDISTQSRCAEAIEIRLELEAMGVLHAAALVAHSLKQESKDPKVQAIRRALSKSSM